MPKTEAPQDIELLKQRHRKLEREKIEAETNEQRAREDLEKLRAEARQKYGTDDLDELKRKLEEMKQENLKKRREYQSHLDGIEQQLGEIERKYAAATAGEG
jgi:hypothetical protein